MESSRSIQYHSGLLKPHKTSSHGPIWLYFLLIGCAAWLYLWQANTVSSANALLQQQHQLSSQLDAQQQQTLSDIAHAQSPYVIMQEAVNLGMTPPQWGDGQP